MSGYRQNEDQLHLRRNRSTESILQEAVPRSSFCSYDAQVSADKKLKKAALDNALQALADPSKAAKVDPVSQAFAQYWKQKGADMEKNKDKVCRSTLKQRFTCAQLARL